jgi:FkbM family methyltransferase
LGGLPGIGTTDLFATDAGARNRRPFKSGSAYADTALRIVVDLQGAQSIGSRSRGIGRYSLALAKAMAANARADEIWIALSGFYPDTVEALRAEFDALVPQRRIVVWHAPGPVAKLEPSSEWRMGTGELLREAFLAGLKPDVVHVSSLFEGLTDDVLTSIGSFDSMLPTAVTLYDLIPLVHRESYLADAMVESWYERKLGHLRRAQLWLAISESSRREAIERLGLPDQWVVNVSTAADAIFRPINIDPNEQGGFLRRYGLTRPFVLYTGGIDKRKNIEGLIGAYARLPARLRASHHLAIVCSATEDQIGRLKRHARQRGLSRDELVVTGFVPDSDLVTLYNLCKAFAFPSWHEGFGLPALEAMSCGAAVIGAGTSSIPEVIGRSDALFDPHDEANIAAKLAQVLGDEDFRQDLRRHALPQAAKFSWDRTSRIALDAMDRLHRRTVRAAAVRVRAPPRRSRLAYVSPLPPERSGIADYSAELLPELARHYEIEGIVSQAEVRDSWILANVPVRSAEWFDQNADSYDRVIYHFGNSTFHAHMFGLLDRHPGTVVLHDFFLSGVLAHMEWTRQAPNAWSRALFDSHGYRAMMERFVGPDPTDVVFRYPANLVVLRQADGVIVHSEFSRELADRWYGAGYSEGWAVIPHLRSLQQAAPRTETKASVGFREDDFLVCSFGMMGPTKLNHRLLETWLASPLAQDERCHLIFVGERDGGRYGREFDDAMARSAVAPRIHVTGFAQPADYRRYLAAADVAVQLRAMSRGESSGTVLDCMGHGVPTVVNAIGAATELPADCVAGLRAEFVDAELRDTLIQLRLDRAAAAELGERAAAYVRTHHNPRAIADRYREAIELFARSGAPSRSARLARRIARVNAVTPPADKDWLNLASCIAHNRNVEPLLPRQWLLDVSETANRGADAETERVTRAAVLGWLNEPPVAFRFEPVFSTGSGSFRYARTTTASMVRIDPSAFVDECVETRPGDVFIAIGHPPQTTRSLRQAYESMRRQGVHLYFVVPDVSISERDDRHPSNSNGQDSEWLYLIGEVADGLICRSSAAADALAARLDALRPTRQRSLRIGWLVSVAFAADESFDAKQLKEIILRDRWHATWHPATGAASWQVAGVPNPHDRMSNPDVSSAVPISEAVDRKARGDEARRTVGAVGVDDFLQLVYGPNRHMTDAIRETVREVLGKSVVETVSDVRTITMTLDRQRFPTAISVRFGASDLRSAVINGIACPVDRHDISVSVPGAATGSWEPHLVACFRRICRPGSIAFDIGANVGYHTLMLAQLVGSGGICYAFEPNSENCRLILLGVDQNRFTNVKLMPIALSDRPGWAYFSPHIGSNGGFATRGAEVADGSGIIVPVFVLDDLCLPGADVIKVDVEGAEYKVLKGAEKSIARSRPVIVSEFSLEMTNRVSGVTGAQYLEWIAAFQYNIFLLDRLSSKLVYVPSVPAFLDAWGSVIRIEDLLFIPSEKSDLIGSD